MKTFQIYVHMQLLFMATVNALTTEWTFQKVVTTILPSNTTIYLCQNTISHDCFVQCSMLTYCLAVASGLDSCLCSSDIAQTAEILDEGLNVFVKRPVNECQHSEYIYHNNFCLKRSSSEKTWFNAKLDCEEDGGNLIVLDSEEKHFAIIQILLQYYPLPVYDEAYHVGASDLNEEGSWKWVKETASDYFLWGVAQPNNKDKDNIDVDGDCLTLRAMKTTLRDDYCLHKKPYICEINL